jgi:hypothetical protein
MMPLAWVEQRDQRTAIDEAASWHESLPRVFAWRASGAYEHVELEPPRMLRERPTDRAPRDVMVRSGSDAREQYPTWTGRDRVIRVRVARQRPPADESSGTSSPNRKTVSAHVQDAVTSYTQR